MPSSIQRPRAQALIRRREQKEYDEYHPREGSGQGDDIYQRRDGCIERVFVLVDGFCRIANDVEEGRTASAGRLVNNIGGERNGRDIVDGQGASGRESQRLTEACGYW